VFIDGTFDASNSMADSTPARSFSLPENPVYGFVGIGVMGYGMAVNLRAKIPESARFVLCEINESRRNQFLEGCKRPVEVASSPKEVAEKSVGEHHSIRLPDDDVGPLKKTDDTVV
jgi:hypothetical protein